MADKIDHTTRLRTILDQTPEVVEYIVSLNPHDFERLRNPQLRKLMGARITVGRLAAMSKRPADELLREISRLTGIEADLSHTTAYPLSPAQPPPWLDGVNEADAVIVDLLAFNNSSTTDVLPRIMHVVRDLQVGAVLLIKHHWEPQPLYDLWSMTGSLEWYAHQRDAETWWIWVKRVR